jgi:biotin operon repressor
MEKLTIKPAVPKRRPREKSMRMKIEAMILGLVATRGPFYHPSLLAELGFSEKAIWRVTQDLVRDGVLKKLGKGKYELSDECTSFVRARILVSSIMKPFPYSLLGMKDWDEVRLSDYLARLRKVWESDQSIQ